MSRIDYRLAKKLFEKFVAAGHRNQHTRRVRYPEGARPLEFARGIEVASFI